MALQLWNVRTKRKEPFVPLRKGRVGVYVCGLTVYDHAHIGHARTAVGFEVLRRWLEHRAQTEHWGHVEFVQNVTDVDDKILARAKERGVSPRAHAHEWDERCKAQMGRLGVREPDQAPHVTTSIPGIINFIQGILANGFGYATPDGNVYFDVPGYDAHAQAHFKDAEGRSCGYGSLSNRDYREMAAGTRKDVEGDKRHPADFALWKAADPGDHPDGNWDSPWGRGRPGWHIECSHMSTNALGDQVDLHGGGQDLVFPHHENEVAQSQAKTGKAPFAPTWVHTGFLNVEGEKMSKSLGNFITLESMLDELQSKGVAAEALRLYFVQTHYRSKIDFSRKGLDEAAKALERLERTRSQLAAAARRGRAGPATRTALESAAKALASAFEDAMDDDLHTPSALAALQSFTRAVNPLLEGETDASPVDGPMASAALLALERCGRVLTLFAGPAPAASASGLDAPAALVAAARSVQVDANGTEAAVMEALLAARAAARKAKDWGRGDAIRDAAKSAGYLVEDAAGGQRWRRM